MPKPTLALPGHDERLASLGREWFAEARRRSAAEVSPPRPRDDGTAGEAGAGLLEGLLSDPDSDSDTDGGGDGE